MSPSTAPETSTRSWRARIGGIWHETWKAALAVAFGALAALVVAPWIQQLLTSPSCDAPGALHLVARSDLAAHSDSVNEPEQGATYEATRAIDGDSSTAWVEGEPDSAANKYGEGETLTISLTRARDVQLVCVINGYARTEATYLHNSRVRQFTVATDVGSTDSVLPEKPLEFFAGYQSVNVPRGRTASIALTIGTARAGQDPSQEADTALSEVEVWAADD